MSTTPRRSRVGARRALERGDRIRLVRFQVGATVYAFDVACVEEVVQPLELTSLPDLPPGVIGVGEHRDHVIPIVDLRVRFGVAAAEPARSHKWILTRTGAEHAAGSLRVGFLVDRVLDVHGTDETPKPPPALGDPQPGGAIEGVVTIEGALSFVLDLPRLVSELGLRALQV